MGLSQTSKLLHGKENHKQNKNDNLQNGREYLQIMQLTRA